MHTRNVLLRECNENLVVRRWVFGRIGVRCFKLNEEVMIVGSIGERLVQLRKEKGLSQEDLAGRLNVTRQAVSNWERGKAQPDLEMVGKLADLLGTSVAYLLGRASEENPAEEVKLNMNSLKYIYLVSFLLIFGYYGFLGMSSEYSFSEECIILAVFLLIETTIYLFFGMAIKSGDYTMLAGYDSKVNYHYPTLKKMTYMLALNWLLMSFFFIFLYIIFMLLKLEEKLVYTGGIFMYIAEGILFTFIINVKYRDQLLPNRKDQDEAKIGNKVVVGFLIGIVLLVTTLGTTMTVFNIHNNTLEAGKLLLFFFPYLVLSIIALFFESSRAKKAVESHEPYRVDWFTYLIMGACLLLLSGMIWTGYQTTLMILV